MSSDVKTAAVLGLFTIALLGIAAYVAFKQHTPERRWLTFGIVFCMLAVFATTALTFLTLRRQEHIDHVEDVICQLVHHDQPGTTCPPPP